ncbi:MAG TPA: histidinol-phosphatase HisJ family protein [Spirochaetia bacterium]|nr:histidinol-phosphatase HisJ family protein [Spirochaetia bacterium]
MGRLLDYHVHPGFSIDAEPSSIRDYCLAAQAGGVEEICFTPHFEVDPVRRALDWHIRLPGGLFPMDNPAWLDVYFREIEAARAEFGPLGLAVRAGLEVGFERGTEETVSRITRAYPFDLVLGSIHCLEHISISAAHECAAYFQNHSLTAMGRSYFAALGEAVKSDLFDVMAHLDLYRRYGVQVYGAAVDTVHLGLVEPVLTSMAAAKVGLEINTSSLARGQTQFHPSEQMVSMARAAGVQLFTTGSDAHRVADVGRGLEQAVGQLERLGLAPAVFCGRRPVNRPD